MNHDHELRRVEHQRSSFGSGRRHSRERGSFAVMGAIWLLVAIVVLGSIDIGHLYFEHRDMQRVADLAALAAVQTMDNTCTQPTTQAVNIASANDSNTITLTSSLPSATAPAQPTSTSADLLSIECGRFDTTTTSSVNGTSQYFTPQSTLLPWNGAWVQITRTVPYFFFGPTRTLSVMSTARQTNLDTFSVAGTLASLGGDPNTNCSSSSPSQTGLINSLLAALLGQGSGLSLNVLSYEALACTNVKLGDLASAAASLGYIGSSTIASLLSANLTVAQIVNVAATALTTTTIANVQAGTAASALATIAKVDGGLTTQIGVGNGSNPLLQLGVANGESAANATVDLLDLVMASAEIAQAGQPAVTLNTSLNLGGATASSIQVQVITAPTIVTGEAGYLASGTPRTEASQGELGVYLNLAIGTTNIYSALFNALGLGGILNLLGSILGNVISINLNLPLYLQIGNATAWLDSIQCAATKAASTITIKAQPSIVNLCIGTPPFKNGQMNLTSTFSCSTSAQLASVQLGSTSSSLVSVQLSPIAVQVAPPGSQTLTFSGAPNPAYATVNSNALGSALSNALSGLSNATITAKIGTISLSLSTQILNILTPVFNALFPALDSVLVPLLNTLGVQVGAATVEQIGLSCGVPQIVY